MRTAFVLRPHPEEPANAQRRRASRRARSPRKKVTHAPPKPPYHPRTLLTEGRHLEASWWRSRPEAGPENRSSIRQPAPGNSGPRAGAAPALPARNRHPGGVGAPPGDTTIPCQELADDWWARSRHRRKRGPTPQGKRRSRAPRGAPARVMGRSSPAIRRWDLPRGRSSGAAYPHQRLSALCSPHVFRGAENGQRAPGAPPQTGRRSVGFFCGARDDGTSGRHAQTPSPGGGGSTRAKRAAGWGEFSRAKIHPTPAQVLRTSAPPSPSRGGWSGARGKTRADNSAPACFIAREKR